MTGLVVEWWRAVRANLRENTRLTAIAVANRPESIALMGALSALPYPVVILSEDPRSWRSTPPLPEATAFVLNGWQGAQAAAARAQGFQVVQLPTVTAELAALPPEIALFSCPGCINFTSGSTGLPKPVYRRSQSVILANLHTACAMGAKPGDNIIGALPLPTTFGFGSVIVAGYAFGSEIALLERFDPRIVLDLFATQRYEYFPAAPVMVDLLGRCPLVGAPPPAPRLTRVVGGLLPPAHYHAFLARFGGPARPAYGSTECLSVAGEFRPVDKIRPGGVGLPYDGIEVRIGAIDTWRAAPGETRGRVWVRSPFLADGYGYPPDVEPFPVVDGWWGSSDNGYFDDQGCLILTGRIDESFKTPAGHLVSPSEITGALLQCAGVVDAAVLPLPRSHGAAVGALVAGSDLDVDTVRAQVSRLLPSSAQPDVLRAVPEIPRTAHGKLSRDACLTILQSAPA